MSRRESPFDQSWFLRDSPSHIDINLPGIYEWQIAGVGSYIGKSKRLKRRLREYPNNVRKLIAGLPYRAGKPQSFRLIHHELCRPREEKRQVIFTIVENCPLTELNEREQFWIAERGVLNRLGR